MGTTHQARGATYQQIQVPSELAERLRAAAEERVVEAAGR